MTSLSFILAEDQNVWHKTATEMNKESIPITAKPAPSIPEGIPPSFMNVIKEKKMNPCMFCPKKFKKPSALKAHLYSHTGEKPNCCPYAGCQRHFSLVSNLRRHTKIHKPEAAKKQRNTHHGGSTTLNKRKVHALLPSPYTSNKCLLAAPFNQQQLPFYYPSIPAPMAKK